MIPTYDQIKPYITQKLISEQRHPDFPELGIFNYTHKAQFDKAWDDVTMQCRGLILNTDTGEVVSRPFPKFFNLSEHETVSAVGKLQLQPGEQPLIYEKYDGSLGIGYRTPNGGFAIATRGSFTSEQAIWATRWIHKNVPGINTMPGMTPLFEIIYSQNRIVVKYDFEGLVFLAVIDNETGKTVEQGSLHHTIGIAKQIWHTDWQALHELAEEGKEGFVIFFPESNRRVKVKFDEYVRLHKIMTGLSVHGIWEYLKENGVESDISEIVQDAPDEFYGWARKVAEDLKKKYREISTAARTVFLKLEKYSVDRKHFAMQAKQTEYAPYLFALLDKKDIEPLIWKAVRPKGKQDVFHQDIDA